MTTNRLYFGDNLDILRNHIPAESVDLIYLDPPFNSSRSYNVLFKDESGLDSEAQITAFDDTWHWGPTAEETYRALVTDAPARVSTAIDALVTIIGRNQMMAYLVMMTARLVELHRVLKPTGSLYLHCDPTASHYLKMILDVIFDPRNFRSEIVWRRTGSHSKSKRYAPIHDTILFYSKSNDYTWHHLKTPYMRGHVDENFVKDILGYRTNYYGNVLTGSGTRNGESGKIWRGFDPTAKGRHWAIPSRLVEDSGEDMSDLSVHEKLDRLYELGYIKIRIGEAWPIYEHYISENDGLALADIWAYQPYTNGLLFGSDDAIDEDVRWLHPKDKERLGYPTQKPEELLERIIKASSNVGDVVLDPFCGCGTAIAAAQNLGRQWIGIDITHLSISLMKYRLESAFNLKPKVDYAVIGEPIDKAGAAELALQNRHQFEWWALSLVRAKPSGSTGDSKKGKKGADRGIDGVINFFDGKAGSHLKPQRVLVQVKSGKVKSGDIRDLVGTVEREKAAMGVFITLEPPTRDMTTEALSAGVYASPVYGKDFPRIQILTIEDLLAGEQVKMPTHQITFKQAERVKSGPTAQNLTLDLYGEADVDEDEDDT